MEKRYYSAESLDNAVRELEQEYGMTSEAFYARYCAGEAMEIPQFNQAVWASFHEDITRMTDGMGVDRPPVMDRVGRAIASLA